MQPGGSPTLADSGPGRRGTRRLPGRVALGGMLGAVGAIVSWWPFWPTEAATGVVNVAVAASFSATAAVLALDTRQRRTAWAIGAAALFYLTSWWWAWPPEWQIGPLPLVSFVLGYLWFALGGLALVQYPGRALERPVERIFFAAMTAWICGGKLILVTVSVPGLAGFGEGAWWFTVVENATLFEVGSTVFDAGLVLFTLGLLVLLVRKVLRAQRLEIVDAAPAVVAAGTVAACGAVYLGARVFVVSDAVQDQLRIVVAIAALATPLAFLTAVLRRTLVRSTLAARVPRLVRSATAELQEELRLALWDPELQLWLGHPDRAGYARADGHPAIPPSESDRCLLDIPSRSGPPLGAIVTTRAVQRYPDLVESVTGAAALALERQAQLEETRASRARINDAELAARRSIRRDIHDGVQQHLLTAKTRLRIVSLRMQQDGTGQQEAVDQVHAALEDALDAFGETTRGGLPPLLASGGLAAALPGVVTRLDLDADLRCTDRRLPPRIEQHLYTFVSEALTNVFKYAREARVAVEIGHRPGSVTVVVADDGPGGADPSAGTGLDGMADRIHAMGGTFTLSSPTGSGTTVEAVVPCE